MFVDRRGSREGKKTSLRQTDRAKKHVTTAQANAGATLMRTCVPANLLPTTHHQPIFDAGCNLANRQFENDFQRVVTRGVKEGVVGMVMVPNDFDKVGAAITLCKWLPGVLYCAAGIHPNNINNKKLSDKQIDQMIQQLREKLVLPEVVAVLSGVDFTRDVGLRGPQEKILRAELKLAEEGDEMSILLDIIKECREDFKEGLVHNFYGSEAQLKHFIDLDLHVAISGIVTGERQAVTSWIPLIPKDKFFLCTDAPYHTPQNISDSSIRESKNEPSNLPHVLQVCSKAYGIKNHELAAIVLGNSKKFFNLMAKQVEQPKPKSATEATKEGNESDEEETKTKAKGGKGGNEAKGQKGKAKDSGDEGDSKANKNQKSSKSKAKKEESSGEEEEEEQIPQPKKGKKAQKTKGKKAKEESEEEEEEEEEIAKPKKAQQKLKAKAKKEDSEEEEEDEEEIAKPKKGQKKAKGKVKNESEDEEEEVPKPKKGQQKAKGKANNESEDEAEEVAKPKKGQQKKAKGKGKQESDEEEEVTKPQKGQQKGKKGKTESSDEEVAAKSKKQQKKGRKKDESSEEEVVSKSKKGKRKGGKGKDASEDEEEAKTNKKEKEQPKQKPPPSKPQKEQKETQKSPKGEPAKKKVEESSEESAEEVAKEPIPEMKNLKIEEEEDDVVLEFACKMCRTKLFTSENLQAQNKHQQNGVKDICKMYFLEEMDWMMKGSQAEGRIDCPNSKCEQKLGRFDVAGISCNCGTTVIPAFKIVKNRVDVMGVAQQSDSEEEIQLDDGTKKKKKKKAAGTKKVTKGNISVFRNKDYNVKKNQSDDDDE